MEMLLFAILVLLGLYGFFLTSTGRDLLKTGLAALGSRRSTAAGRSARAVVGEERQRFGGRSTFGQRQR